MGWLPRTTAFGPRIAGRPCNSTARWQSAPWADMAQSAMSSKPGAPGRSIRFRFTEPEGFVGTHRFEIESLDGAKTRLRHVIEMRATGLSWLAWTLAIRSLHDALLEDALDRAEMFAGKELPKREWSTWVKFVRWIMRRRKRTAS